MTTHDIPKHDEAALQALLDDIERTVRDAYWNGEWAQSGARITWHTSKYREQTDNVK